MVIKTELSEDDIGYIDWIEITTGDNKTACIYKNLVWVANDIVLESKLNNEFGPDHWAVLPEHLTFNFAIYVLADQASHALGGKITRMFVNPPRKNKQVKLKTIDDTILV